MRFRRLPGSSPPAGRAGLAALAAAVLLAACAACGPGDPRCDAGDKVP